MFFLFLQMLNSKSWTKDIQDGPVVTRSVNASRLSHWMHQHRCARYFLWNFGLQLRSQSSSCSSHNSWYTTSAGDCQVFSTDFASTNKAISIAPANTTASMTAYSDFPNPADVIDSEYHSHLFRRQQTYTQNFKKRSVCISSKISPFIRKSGKIW